MLYMSGKVEKPLPNPEFIRIYGHPVSLESERVFITFSAMNIPF